MAATRRQHKNQKESAWVPPLQRDPGPWNRLLLNWLATLAIIMVFGLVMLYSASYTTGYLRMGDSLHYICLLYTSRVVGVKIRLGSHGKDGTGLDVHHDGAAAVLSLIHILSIRQEEDGMSFVLEDKEEGTFVVKIPAL